jgi:tRNA dimethylallyltransferase
MEILGEVKHHFVNEKNISEPFTAGDFVSEAMEGIQEIRYTAIFLVGFGGDNGHCVWLFYGFLLLC